MRTLARRRRRLTWAHTWVIRLFMPSTLVWVSVAKPLAFRLMGMLAAPVLTGLLVCGGVFAAVTLLKVLSRGRGDEREKEDRGDGDGVSGHGVSVGFGLRSRAKRGSQKVKQACWTPPMSVRVTRWAPSPPSAFSSKVPRSLLVTAVGRFPILALNLRSLETGGGGRRYVTLL